LWWHLLRLLPRRRLHPWFPNSRFPETLKIPAIPVTHAATVMKEADAAEVSVAGRVPKNANPSRLAVRSNR